MNEQTEWQKLLRLANEELPDAYKLRVESEDINSFTVYIGYVVYASGCFEDELEDIVNEAMSLAHIQMENDSKRTTEQSKSWFPVVTIDRDGLRAYGLNSDVSDETMEDIARRMSEWFDDLYESALLSCAKAAGVKSLDDD